jgi:hypothetical protein
MERISLADFAARFGRDPAGMVLLKDQTSSREQLAR